MKLNRRGHRQSCKINMTSLIDVIFLLIIFFMTVSQVTQSEAELIDLPKSQNSQPDDHSQLKRIVINIRDNGTIIMFGDEQTTESAHKLLTEDLINHGKDNVIVLIRADSKTEWDSVAAIMQLCTNNGIRRVRVAIRETTQSHPGL